MDRIKPIFLSGFEKKNEMEISLPAPANFMSLIKNGKDTAIAYFAVTEGGPKLKAKICWNQTEADLRLESQNMINFMGSIAFDVMTYHFWLIQ